ncbi:MAG: MFS transporter, partial [Simkaniaceae bacterium]|nr:MFS transporter [Simkaniaceae bacterium]
LGALMYGIFAGAEANWTSILAWMFLTMGIGALILLIILDEKQIHPLLDLHIFKKELIILSALSCAFGGVASTVFMFFDPLYLRILRHLSPFLIGLLIAVIPSAQVLISLAFDRLVKRFGIANLLFFSILSAFLAIVLHLELQLDTPLLFLIIPFFLLGVNWGLSNAATITAINEEISPRHIGSALGTIMTIWNIVGSILLAISTAVFHASELRSSFLPAFHTTVYFNIGFGAFILMAAIFLRLHLKRKEHGQ